MSGKGVSKGGSASKKTPPSSGSKGKQQVISGFFTKKQPAASPPAQGGGEGNPKQGSAAAQETPAPAPKPATPKSPKINSSPITRRSPGGSAKKQKVAEGPGEELVGARVNVWWPLDKAWYKGNVKQWDGKQSKHQIAYDDGDVEWVTLGNEKWTQLNGEAAAANGAHKSAAPPAKRGGRLMQQGKPTKQQRVVLYKDDDEDEDMESSDSQDDSGSEFDAGGEAGDDSDMGGLEDEVSEDAEEEGLEDDSGNEVASAGKKRKSRQSSSKRKLAHADSRGQASKKKASPTRTPATPAHPPARGASLHKAPPSAGPPSTGTANNNNCSASGGSWQQGLSSGGGSWQNITPQAGARKALHSKLDVRTSPAAGGSSKEPQLVHGVATRLSNEDTCRFQDHMASNYPFLHPSRIMDAKRRRPDHPDYDPRTLHLPPNFFKENKVSPGQQQWWETKAANFDSVLLFKQGKFYEMFEMDAFVGVDVLGLTFMKGDKPHAGFPEVRYHDMAEGLARAGYRVVVVEQTETPEGLARRNQELRKAGQKLANVVNREKVAVLSKGLLMDAEMVAAKPDPSYVISVFETEAHAGAADTQQRQQQQEGSHPVGLTRLGVCAVDVASGHILLGEFIDDEVRSALRTHLAALQPVEVVLPRGRNACSLVGALGCGLDPTTSRVLQTALRDPRPNLGRTQWDVDRLLQELRSRKYFSKNRSKDAEGAYAGWPPVLRSLAAAYASAPAGGEGRAAPGAAALLALSGLLDFLQEALLDRAVLPMGRMEALPAIAQADAAAQLQASGDANAEQQQQQQQQQQHMLLNGAALENLEVLENTEGGVAGTLLSVLDHCSTPFGRRRLRQWLCRPLYQVHDIELRQDAVSDLMTMAAESAGAARKDMAGISDLERAVARLAASTVEGAAGRDAAHVVLYEDAAKRKVKALTSAIKDLQAVSRAVRKFYPVLPWTEGSGGQARVSSKLLLTLFEQSRWSRIEAALDSLAQAANWSEAEKTGRVMPAEGVDARHDAACQAVTQRQAALASYLTQVRKQLGGGDKVNYVVAANKDRLLEVPDGCAITREFTLDAGGKKGFKRYTTERLVLLSGELRDAEDEREAALSVVLQGMVRRFVDDRALWVGAVEAVAELDALMSLAAHALNADGAVCRPRLVAPAQGGGPPVFEAKGLRHPSGLPGLLGSFVPNDVALGGQASPAFIVLTGPNMGGKSTLLRQVCLAALLAQVGGCVPADSLTLSPVDAIFVRMGARDHIMTGQSTFFVELAETAAMLHKATSRSLVALDELGRGTATLDGAAIASAVLRHMSGQIQCRGLFATHYHHLAVEHAHDPRVAIMHMACAVSGPPGQSAPAEGPEEAAGAVEEVTFLYKLVPGACPKSYGTNVARLAGLPGPVVARAAHMSATTVSEPGAPRPTDEDGGQQQGGPPGHPSAQAGLGGQLREAVAQVAQALATSYQQRAAGEAGHGDAAAAAVGLEQLRSLQAMARQACAQQC